MTAERYDTRGATRSDREPEPRLTVNPIACEAHGLWGGAIRHLDVLLEGSGDPALFARRGKAHVEMGQHEAALADFGKALAKESSRWEWLVRSCRGTSP